MIADDYREIEAGYLTKRNGSSSLDREEFKVTEGEVVEGRSLGGNGSKGEGEPVERTKFLKRSFDSQTSMSLRRARQVVNSLLKESRAEDVTYDSVRVVVLDVRLPLNQAFFALEENGIRSAPVFNMQTQQYVGILSFSDLVDLLLHIQSTTGQVGLKSLQGKTIEDWRGLTMREAEDSWNVFVNADASLYEACCVLQEKKVHRLPVFSRKSNLVVDVMTHARILHFVHSKLQRRGGTTNRSSSNSAALNELFDATPEELGIGTFCNISTLSYTSTIAEALRLFSENKLSCLPITDETNRVVDIYHRTDVAQFCQYDFDVNLDLSLHEAITTYRTRDTRAELCRQTATLREVFAQFNKVSAHRLYCVDEEQRIVGAISLSDVFRCFL